MKPDPNLGKKSDPDPDLRDPDQDKRDPDPDKRDLDSKNWIYISPLLTVQCCGFGSGQNFRIRNRQKIVIGTIQI